MTFSTNRMYNKKKGEKYLADQRKRVKLDEDLEIKKAKVSVIPLIPQNSYATSSAEKFVTTEHKGAAENDISKYGLNIISRNSSGNVRQAPILAQNAIPGIDSIKSEKGKFLHDIAHRPDDMKVDEYEKVPIEDFGKALLMGMGWKEGTAVGKNPNGLIEPIQMKPRVALLGLGAQASPVSVEPPGKKKILPGDKIERKSVDTKEVAAPPRARRDIIVGSYVEIIGGSRKGKRGTVLDIYQKQNEKAVKVKIDGSSSEIVRVWLDQIKLGSDDRERNTSSWLRPHIKVRIISKTFQNGDLYNTIGIIQDVTSHQYCVIRTQKGLIDRLHQSYLETVIPPVGGTIMVVGSLGNSHEDIGDTGRIMEVNKSRGNALVQMNSSFELKTIPFDDMAEFND